MDSGGYSTGKRVALDKKKIFNQVTDSWHSRWAQSWQTTA